MYLWACVCARMQVQMNMQILNRYITTAKCFNFCLFYKTTNY